jgi:hypothetical protein
MRIDQAWRGKLPPGANEIWGGAQMVQQILNLGNPEVVGHGTGIAFDLATTGSTTRLMIPTVDLAKVLQFFASIATLTDDDGSTPSGDLFPISVTGLGYQEGETPDSSLLIAKIGAVLLALEIPRASLESTAQKLLMTASKRGVGTRPN